jgi:hypothetical protein
MVPNNNFNANVIGIKSFVTLPSTLSRVAATTIKFLDTKSDREE